MAGAPVGKPGGTTGAVGQGPADKQVVKDEKQAEERYQADKVQSAPGTHAEDKLLGKPAGGGGQLGSKAGPPLLREADADDFALALKNVIGPLPSPKQWEVQKLFEAFMDYALRGADSFQSALRSKYP
ncbi:MAG TPA: hypothetical protein VNS88_07805 [Nitrospiraceae bacterium]|nr:hypothetical protein [Nitrospiraceae bacterium]